MLKSFPRWSLPAALALTACSVLQPSSGSTGAPSTAVGSEHASAAITDANIAAIVVAANNADIKYADLALAKSQDADIRKFAMMTKMDHESVNKAAIGLVTRLKVTPVDNQRSFDLRDDAEAKRLLFRDLEGFAFDSAYIVNEVSYHKTLLAAIDDALIPSAKNAELKALLVSVRPAVAAHLDHAEVLAARQIRRR